MHRFIVQSLLIVVMASTVAAQVDMAAVQRLATVTPLQ